MKFLLSLVGIGILGSVCLIFEYEPGLWVSAALFVGWVFLIEISPRPPKNVHMG